MPGKSNKRTYAPTPKVNEAIKHNDSITIPAWAPYAVVIFTALLYSKALFNSLTTYDDDFYITNNPFIRHLDLHSIKVIFTSFYKANYHPFTTLVWSFIYNISGNDPLPYHLLNVIMHLLNTMLVYKLAEHLSGRKTTALIASLLFAVHPMHVESVAWATELKDVMYSFFYLLSLLLYLRYISGGYKAKQYTGVLLLFIASLLSKPAAVTLPVLFIVIDLYKGRKVNARSLTEKIPFLLLSLLFGILAILSQQAGAAYSGLIISYNPIHSFFMFTSELAFYFLWSVAPVRLCIFHYFPSLHNGFLPWPYYASLPVMMVIAWIIARRNPYRKEILFGVSFFLVTISVMLQFFSVGSSLTSERYSYISYIGIFYIIGQIVSVYIDKNKHRNITIGLFSIFIMAYTIQSWYRIDVWKNDRALYTDLVNNNPYFYYGYFLMGTVEKNEGNLQEALNDFTKTIELNPKFEEAYYDRGVINDALHNTTSAINDYTVSIKLDPKQADSYNNRGWDQYKSGDTPSAMKDYNKAIELKPGYAKPYNNRAWAYDQSGDVIAAMRDYTKAIYLDSSFLTPVFNRAALKAKTGDFKGAIEDYSLLLKINPDDNTACFFTGKAYFELKDYKNACLYWQKAKQSGNKNADGMIQQYCH